MERFRSGRPFFLAALSVLAVISGGGGALLGVCGPFADVAADAFCPFVLEIFALGITTGTTPATYDPASGVSRLQMAAFLSRSVDSVLKRGGRRAALDQFWTTQNHTVLCLTPVGSFPRLLKSDGPDVWVANHDSGTVSHVRSTDGKLLETWVAAGGAYGVLVAMGRVFVTGQVIPGRLYRINPTEPAGAVTTVADALGSLPVGIAFDGARIWTANYGNSVSIVTPGSVIPWTVTTVTTGFSAPAGILSDGANIWVTNSGANTLLKLDASGGVLQTVTVGTFPGFPVYDGTNIWVPAAFNMVTVVRASNGAVLQTLTGNGMSTPAAAAFDGQRVLVTNYDGKSVSLWKAADLTTIGSFPMPSDSQPVGACSDGVAFWITLTNIGQIARF